LPNAMTAVGARSEKKMSTPEFGNGIESKSISLQKTNKKTDAENGPRGKRKNHEGVLLQEVRINQKGCREEKPPEERS